VFKTGSKGGLKAYSKLMTAFIARYQELDLNERQDVYPIVQLTSSNYKHPKWGKIFTPVMDVVGWADQDGDIYGEEAEEEPAPEPKKPRRRRRAPAK
jgi:hypothetical protein